MRRELTATMLLIHLTACSSPPPASERDHDDFEAPDAGSGAAPSEVAAGGAGAGASQVGGGGSTAAAPQPDPPAPGAWVALEPGSFVMGAAPGESCFTSDNQDLHHVTLTRAFEISATELTQAEHLAVTGRNISSFQSCGPDCPTEMATWHLAAAGCNALSAHSNLPSCYACEGEGAATSCTPLSNPYECAGYRLPTEAEWEYAYRAGTGSPVHNGELTSCGSLDGGLDAIAWFLYNAAGTTHPVAQKQPNAWGLYDMSGNVWEWVHDGYQQHLPEAVDPVVDHDELKVMRGGSYNCVPGELRAAHRSGLPANIAGQNVGFRCARTL